MSESKKILIVEDDPLLQEFYKVLFKKLGYEFSVSEDGDDIINQVSNGSISLLIVDLNLKNTYLNSKAVDGLTLARYVKQNFYNLRIPILIITAYSSNYFADQLLKDSLADDYMLKPILNFDKLTEKINKLLCLN
ncbi:MAG: response regulator [Bacteroidota bacterium]